MSLHFLQLPDKWNMAAWYGYTNTAVNSLADVHTQLARQKLRKHGMTLPTEPDLVQPPW